MSEGRKFQLNIKFGGGYEAPLLNIEGDSADEFQANVAFAVDNAEAIIDAAVAFQAGYNVKKPQDNPPPAPKQGGWSNKGSQQSTQQAASAPADAGPSGPAPTCRHGEMQYRPAGYSQRTKSNYNAFWSCPSRDRNDKCDTVNA